MQKSEISYRIYRCIFMILLFLLTGCSQDTPEGKNPTEIQAPKKEPQPTEIIEEETTDTLETAEAPEAAETRKEPEAVSVPVIEDTDWTEYFDGLNGAAVIYDPDLNRYLIHNQDLAMARRSPCSTFKIISSLAALEHGVINPEDSVRVWSGENFWNEKWNQDINFPDAFRSSCVWYFRKVIDETGADVIKAELERLQYGNCDISDWEGRLNANNSNPALTGFWLESSLLISPKEQTEVMERIFGRHTEYSEETIRLLKEVMLLEEADTKEISIYGKTGMGKAHGVVADAWFTGFAENGDQKIYFCVYLGETPDGDVSSTHAREIAVKIVSEFLQRSPGAMSHTLHT